MDRARRREERRKARAEEQAKAAGRNSSASYLHPSTLRWLGQSMSHRLRRRLSGGYRWIRAHPAVAAVAGPRTEPARPRKTLILHVGMGKTGTTAIQNALWDNREVLAASGVTYPTVGTVANAHHLVAPRCPPFLAHAGWRFLDVSEWAPLLLGAGTDRIVMSSELIVWAEPDQVAALCAALRELFDVKACLYLRRQDNTIMASYNQMIKAGTQIATIDKVIEKQLDRFDYLAKIWPWEKALGAENLIVLPYERGQFHKGDLIDDFLLKVLGIERPEGFAIGDDKNPNPRLSRGAMEYKRCINNVIRDVASSSRFNPVIARYSEGTDAGSGAIFHEHDLLSPEQRSFVMRVFEPGNAYIARKFMGREDGALFLDLDIPKGKRKAATVDLGPEFRAISEVIAREEPELFAELRAVAEASVAKSGNPAVQQAAADLLASFGAAPARQAAAPPAA
ncbi:MAG TPA: hypothetical protein VM899_11295 [Rubellimicrobium sp.]|nr:hypothetical protein [Rubellimicrobium sp.]